MCAADSSWFFTVTDSDSEWITGVNVVTGRVLFVLQTAVASLQIPDSDTEWKIGVNVMS